MQNTTLLFLIKKSANKIERLCLGMKKIGQGVGKWNGAGGKVEPGEALEDAAKRETEEEVGVEVKTLYKVAEVEFVFRFKPEWDQLMHVYFSEEWTGDLKESNELKPRWFQVSEIPYAEMWPDDYYWLPEVLAGKFLQARFVFGENDEILEKEIKRAVAY